MNNKEIIKNAFWQAAATFGYISAISSFLFSSKDLSWGKPSVFIPIIMLSLFVFSAALTGSLVLGQSILWYIDGRRRESVTLLIATLSFFLSFIIVIAAGLFFLQ